MSKGMGWVDGSSISYNPPIYLPLCQSGKLTPNVPDSLAAVGGSVKLDVGVNLGQQR